MGAGEAETALSLFFAASAIGPSLTVFVDEAVGRAVRAALLDVVGRIVEFVAGFTADLAGPAAALRLAVGFFSLVIEGAMLTRFVVGADADFDTGALTDALGAIDTLPAVPLLTGFLLLSVELGWGSGFSSIESVDGLDLCPVLAAVAASTACAGFLGTGTDPGAGRVGGLLKLLPEAVRDVEDADGFVAGVGAELKGRLAVTVVRFGGMPFLLGEMGASRGPSLVR